MSALSSPVSETHMIMMNLMSLGLITYIPGAAIPFQFEFDISKVDQDEKNCFTVQFLPPRIYEYHTDPSSTPLPETLGCFVL